MRTEKKKLKKTTRDGYMLLGKDAQGVRYWLAEPSWDCDWYWGLGYVNTFTRSGRMVSHTHFDCMFLNGPKRYYLDAWDDLFVSSVLTEDEIWELMDLMKSAYTLKDAAEVLGMGSSHISSGVDKGMFKDQEYADRINRIYLPRIFARIQILLTGDGSRGSGGTVAAADGKE